MQPSPDTELSVMIAGDMHGYDKRYNREGASIKASGRTQMNTLLSSCITVCGKLENQFSYLNKYWYFENFAVLFQNEVGAGRANFCDVTQL
jgi:hypothetical protein